jgi:hypothetical protein
VRGGAEDAGGGAKDAGGGAEDAGGRELFPFPRSPIFLRARPLAREENDEARLAGSGVDSAVAHVFAWIRSGLLDQKRTAIRGGRGTERLAFSKSLDPSPSKPPQTR